MTNAMTSTQQRQTGAAVTNVMTSHAKTDRCCSDKCHDLPQQRPGTGVAALASVLVSVHVRSPTADMAMTLPVSAGPCVLRPDRCCSDKCHDPTQQRQTGAAVTNVMTPHSKDRQVLQ